jgi:hypothetical protein
MVRTCYLAAGLAAVVIASAATLAPCPNAGADPAPPAPNPAELLPGLSALTQLSPIIQQAAADPQQASQLLMAAASAFTHNPTVSDESKNVASSVNQFAQEPTAHIPPVGVEPGAKAHLPTGTDPVHAAGPAAATEPAPAPAAAPAAALTPSDASLPTAAVNPDSPPMQDFMYPSIGSNCLPDGGSSIAPALSVAGPAKIPAPGPAPGQTAYVFTAVGTSGPADVQQLPLNVTWVNLTTGKSGSATLQPHVDINPDGPTTLTAIADTGSGSIMSTIFGQVTTKDKQCQFLPTIGSTVVP